MHMRHDTRIIEAFLRGHNQVYRTTFSLREIPDEGGRRSGIDGLARDVSGQSWALEHTLLQPFRGEKDDTRAFLAVFAPLESDPSMPLPGYEFDLAFRTGAIPKGTDWAEARRLVQRWFLANRERLPEGEGIHSVPGLPFILEVLVDKKCSQRPRVRVARLGVPDTLGLVVRKALSRKLAKLIKAPADLRFLIFEKADIARGYVDITTEVNSLLHEFPTLSSLDAIWVANTMGAESDNIVFFLRVWPDGVTAKFKCEWEPLISSPDNALEGVSLDI
jgi:hypothetical protein